MKNQHQSKIITLYKDLKKLPYHSPSVSSGSNSKLKKDAIASFSLPAGITCPGAGQCHSEKFCYAQNGNYSRTNVLKMQISNWLSSQTDSFIPIMTDRIARLAGRINFLRIHDSGDFYSQEYVSKWVSIIENTSHFGILFYAYTKSFAFLDLNPLWNSEGMNLIQSTGSKDDHKIDYSKPHAKIFSSLDELKKSGYQDASNSDMPAATGHKLIGLVVHGQGAKSWKEA